ncbi:MAG: branched-chain amino acid ABC transporter permease [Candidatus Nanopelagicales bacterium]|jgi:branched-chain amino acid transport system permease protein|nr:branched-chain amino acid ABC transporter permease [Candidatus Nanopelagicales bacterium]
MVTFFDHLLGGIASGSVIALMAIALVLVWRSTRVVNFAQVGQAMFTTFLALAVYRGTGNWLISLIAAILAGAILGLIVHFLVMRPVRRQDGSGAIIATFGVLIALQASASMIWGVDPQAYPPIVDIIGFEAFGRTWPFSRYDVLVLGVTVLLVLLLSVVFTRTSLGLRMRASAFNPTVARLSGVRVSQMLALGWALAGSIGAIAGVLIAPTFSVTPYSFDILLILAFTVAVIGGLDSLVGAVAFGIGTGLVLSLVSGYSDSGNASIVALVLLALNLLLKPEGVFAHHHSRSV